MGMVACLTGYGELKGWPGVRAYWPATAMMKTTSPMLRTIQVRPQNTVHCCCWVC